MRGIETSRAPDPQCPWDHDYDLAGKRVAVIGTGASAVQIIPELVKTAASVKVFQRTPGWVLPRMDLAPRAREGGLREGSAGAAGRPTALFLGHEAAATGLVWDSPVTTLIQRLGRALHRLAVKDPGCAASSPPTSGRAASGC